MNVGAQEKPIIDPAPAAFAFGADVSGLENREDLLAGDKAALLIDVGDEDAEAPLAQPLLHEYRVSVDGDLVLVGGDGKGLKPLLDRSPGVPYRRPMSGHTSFPGRCSSRSRSVQGSSSSARRKKAE